MKEICKNCGHVREEEMMDCSGDDAESEYYCGLAMTECENRTDAYVNGDEGCFCVEKDHGCDDFRKKKKSRKR